MSDTSQQQTAQDENLTEIADKAKTELPGRRLRDQRESNHLSQEEVAHHLRLDVQLIKGLEDDDYSQLPSPAYICGYLRSYARLLKLPENEIVQAYSHGKQIDSALIPQSVSITLKKTGNPAFIKTALIIIIVVLVLGGVYLVADKFDLFTIGSSQKSSKVTVSVVPKALEPQRNESAKAVDTPQEPAAKDVEEAPQAQAPTAPSATGKTFIEKLPTPKTKIPQNETVATAPAAAPASPVTATTPAKNVAAKNTVAAASAQLRLHFNGDSWAEVKDSTGKRLLYKLVTKDADVNLAGEPPFTILLGNAPDVQVFYNGKEFDHKGYHRGEIAYFHVGAK